MVVNSVVVAGMPAWSQRLTEATRKENIPESWDEHELQKATNGHGPTKQWGRDERHVRQMEIKW